MSRWRPIRAFLDPTDGFRRCPQLFFLPGLSLQMLEVFRQLGAAEVTRIPRFRFDVGLNCRSPARCRNAIRRTRGIASVLQKPRRRRHIDEIVILLSPLVRAVRNVKLVQSAFGVVIDV